jgi:hypothetical protein
MLRARTRTARLGLGRKDAMSPKGVGVWTRSGQAMGFPKGLAEIHKKLTF